MPRRGEDAKCRRTQPRSTTAAPAPRRVPVTTARVLPVILAGGAGTRLWPLSRERHPKQFLPLTGERTMLQQTLDRLRGLGGEAPVIVCHHDHRFTVAEQCRELSVEPSAVILEPVGRNTAPALALAALQAAEDDPVLLALPADGHIGNASAFHAAVRRAMPLAAAGDVVAFGVPPDRAETGYGYIQVGAPLDVEGDTAVAAAKIAAFTEKPSRQMAEGYLAAGGYCWNSGMFAVRASVYLEELRTFRPAIDAACAAAVAAQTKDLDFHRPGSAFADSPADSIDYAVMEHTRRGVVVVPAQMQWSDVGSWRTLAEVLPADAEGNTTSGDVVAVATRNSHLVAQGRLIAAIGVEDLVVVETADAVLVASQAHAAEVKTVVERLRTAGRPEHRDHAIVYRPWGQAETFAGGRDAGYLVKRITVRPGEALSLQSHRHRAEHWVVVRGEATVQRGEETFILAEDESTYIPAGARHRLSNRGPAQLDLIEVQVGPLLTEDDIVRYDDRYGRDSDAGSLA